jgi:arylsulfatase A-like enzyme
MPPIRPHVVIVVADDMGYSDLGCYGGEIATPTLDGLGRAGIRLSRFYNTTRCSPSRASLLTGLHPHQAGIGILTSDDRPDGYRGSLNERCLTLAEMLREAGYSTCLSGKWHLASEVWQPTDAWPTQRGFDRFFGTIAGCGSYYRPTTSPRRLKISSTRRPRASRAVLSFSTSPTPHRTGPCTRRPKTSRNTGACSTPAGTSCARPDYAGWSPKA